MKFFSVSFQLVILMALHQGHRKSSSRLLRWLILYNGDSSLGHTILGEEPGGIKRRFELSLAFFLFRELTITWVTL